MKLMNPDISRKIAVVMDRLIKSGIKLEPVFDEFETAFNDGKPLLKAACEIGRKSGDDAVSDFIDQQMLAFLEARAPVGAIGQNSVKSAKGRSREELAAEYLKEKERRGSTEDAVKDYESAKEEHLKRGRSGCFRFGSA